MKKCTRKNLFGHTARLAGKGKHTQLTQFIRGSVLANVVLMFSKGPLVMKE